MSGIKLPGILQFALLTVLFVGCDSQNQQAEKTQRGTNASEAAATQSSSASSASSEQRAIDSHPGKALHDANCISCHDTGKYQSAARRVTDFPALLTRVRRCGANLNPPLADDNLVQIADYLNQAFYRYNKQ